jgi:peptide chain release factor 1
MKPFLRAQLERYTQRLTELDYLLSREDIMANMAQFLTLSREHAEVSVIGQRWAKLQQREQDLIHAQAMLGEGDDEEMRQLAQEEIAQAQSDCLLLEAELQPALAATNRPCLPVTCCACTHATRKTRAGV